MDVSQRVNGDFEEAKEFAQKIKNDVKSTEEITCSIGIGPNKLVAKIASNIKKPDGLTVVKPDQVWGFLSPMPVCRLIGACMLMGPIRNFLSIVCLPFSLLMTTIY